MSPRRVSLTKLNAAGSPLPGEPAFLAVGRLRHPHGIKGEILMEVITDFPERLEPGMQLFLEGDVAPLKLIKRRHHSAGLLMTFEGYSTPEQVGELRNQVLYVRADDRPPLPEGEYYHHQLIHLQVITDEGEHLGTVAEILETGASDVLVVSPDSGPEILIPVADAFIRKINLDRGEITVHLIPGILTEEP